MGCFSSKVAPFPPVDRVRNKKERKMLKKILKMQGIKAKVSKSGVAFDIPVSNDFRRPKLPPTRIGISTKQSSHNHLSTPGEKTILQRLEEKQEKARLRREEQQKAMKEKMRRQSLKRQTNYKVGVLFHLLDLLQ
ncbi:uncharacterized protein LOC133204807 [Saccostrea echinata]|uniref:uncharacterized protein LOC133204807 n=1 Tax=Saccostrea echinata TaxID=191078 RepID=UPI002A8091F2|nr:uncharacterized protein LOC133204807 [Saccostrea echinata]